MFIFYVIIEWIEVRLVGLILLSVDLHPAFLCQNDQFTAKLGEMFGFEKTCDALTTPC